MPDGPYLTPDEETLVRMIREAGSSGSAGASLVDRLTALEAAVAALESTLPAAPTDGAPSGDSPAETVRPTPNT